MKKYLPLLIINTISILFLSFMIYKSDDKSTIVLLFIAIILFVLSIAVQLFQYYIDDIIKYLYEMKEKLTKK